MSPPPSSLCVAKSDSAATSHYWKYKDKHVLSNVNKSYGHPVTLPNEGNTRKIQQGSLPLSNKLSKKIGIETVLQEFRSFSLLSLGQLCDDDCDILLNKKKMYVIKDKLLILQGTRNNLDGLRDVPVY